MHHTGIARGMVCGAAFAVPVSSVLGTVLEFEFTGIVTFSLGETPISVGDSFSGHFSYDSDALLSGGDGVHEAFGTDIILSFIVEYQDAGTGDTIASFDFGGHESSPGPFFDRFRVFNDLDNMPGLFDQILLRDIDEVDGEGFRYDWILQDTGNPPDALDSVALPLTLGLDDWNTALFRLEGLSGGLPSIHGDILTLTQLSFVPIPPAVYLGTLGIVAVIVFRRKIL